MKISKTRSIIKNLLFHTQKKDLFIFVGVSLPKIATSLAERRMSLLMDFAARSNSYIKSIALYPALVLESGYIFIAMIFTCFNLIQCTIFHW